MNRDSRPSLIFSRNDAPEAWRNSALSQFNDKNGHNLFRELIQNSLDASRPDLPAHVLIRREKVERKALPGLLDIHRAVEASGKSLEHIPETSVMVPKILTALGNDKFDTLTFIDNGIGLDKTNMRAILSDGASGKEKGLGSYGNGHITAFVFSEIRYVLYAGVSEAGVLASGHTILASHKIDKCKYGKDGFLVKDFGGGDFEYDYEYFSQMEFDSTIIADAIKIISDRSGYGSAVIIPAFSIDESDEDISKKIIRYASLHFFPAILDGQLIVSYEDDNSSVLEINAANIRELAREFEGEGSSIGLIDGPKGKNICEAIDTYAAKNEIYIDTKGGRVKCFLRNSTNSHSNINVFRDGMWITHRIRQLSSGKFANYMPFDLVINVAHDDDPLLYELIRASEGSLHMHLKQRLGHEREWKELQKYWLKLRDQLKELLTEDRAEEVYLPDFALIDVSRQENQDNQGLTPIGKWRRDRIVTPPPPSPPTPPVPNSNEYFDVFGEQAVVKGQAKREGDSLRASIILESDVEYPELRVAEVLGADDACERAGDKRLSDYDYCEIRNITVNDEFINLKKKGIGIRKRPTASGDNLGVYAVRLNALKRNKPVHVQVMFGYRLGDPKSNVMVEIVKRTGKI